GAHGHQVAARLPAGAVECQHAAVGTGENVGSDGAGDRRLGAEPVLGRLEGKERQRADDDAFQRGALAVVADIDALARLLILLGAALEGEALDMDEGAGDSERVTAAGMDADPAVLVLDADARRAVGGLLALVAEPVADGRDRLRYRDQALKLLRPQQQRHATFLPILIDCRAGSLKDPPRM